MKMYRYCITFTTEDEPDKEKTVYIKAPEAGQAVRKFLDKYSRAEITSVGVWRWGWRSKRNFFIPLYKKEDKQ